MILSTGTLGQADDVALRAAFIYNFALFSTWQSPSTSAEFRVCAPPEGPLWNSLHRLRGKLVGTRRWAVFPLPLADAPQQCDIVVISVALPAPTYPSTLIVRDGEPPLGDSAAITLVNEGDHIRFHIDTRAARRSGVTFSSKLLSLARSVQ